MRGPWQAYRAAPEAKRNFVKTSRDFIKKLCYFNQAVVKIRAKLPKISRSSAASAPHAHYQRVLELKAEEVRRGLSAKRAAEIVHLAGEPLDFGDYCQKSHDEWLFLKQNRLECELLRELEAALRRLAKGEYGICQGCREPISAIRLEALPWARFCVGCQEAAALAESPAE